MAWRSSRFLELTRISSPWIWLLTPLGPSSRMILVIFLAFSLSRPALRQRRRTREFLGVPPVRLVHVGPSGAQRGTHRGPADGRPPRAPRVAKGRRRLPRPGPRRPRLAGDRGDLRRHPARRRG